MSTLDKLLKEAEGFTPALELTTEEKKEFLQTQLEGFAKQYYRFEVDIEVGKKYIKVGEKINEEGYVSTGEEKIKESVQHMRSIVVHMDKLKDLIDKLDK